MEALTYLKVADLYPHPDNPRKDVGDISELAASIRTNGVLQNLIVVPGHIMSRADWVRIKTAMGVPPLTAQQAYNKESAKCSDGYTVIIGHRRLAAAREAGLQELPCIISDMNEKEQFQTMLVENMQRSDLSPMEEADGMQLMIDNWGATVSSISESTGLSESTVRRRLSIGKLDRKKVEKGRERGATLGDYLKLDRIKDEKAKDEVLTYIGSSEFSRKLQEAEEEQQFQEYIAGAYEYIQAHATPKENGTPCTYVTEFGRYSQRDPAAFMKESKEYCYKANQLADKSIHSIDLYELKSQQPEAPKEKTREQKLQELREEYGKKLDEIYNEMQYESQSFRDLREGFIEDFTQYKLYDDEIIRMAQRSMMLGMESGNSCKCGQGEINRDEIGGFLNIAYDSDTDTLDEGAYESEMILNPLRVLLITAYTVMESIVADDPFTKLWEADVRAYRPVFHQDKNLELLYRMLAELGYEISKEEEAFLKGACLQYNEAKALMDRFNEEARCLSRS